MTLALSISNITKGVGTALKSNSIPAKLAKIGGGFAVAGAGVGVGLDQASKGISEGGRKVGSAFGVPTNIVFIVGAVIVLLVLLGLKK